jgi:Ca2+-binding RTX toxin-like protein
MKLRQPVLAGATVILALASSGGAVAAHAAAPNAAPNTAGILPRPGFPWVTDVVVSTGDVKDRIRVSRDGDVFVVDVSTGVTPGARCTAAGPTVVRCPTADIATVTVTAGDGDDVIVVEPAAQPGGKKVDRTVLRGGPGNDMFLGGDGNDDLQGGPGDDYLWANDGADMFRADASSDGADDMRGGDGRDWADYSARSAGVAVSLDGVENDGTIGQSERDNVDYDVESVLGGRGNDRLVGNDLDNRLDGGKGDDVIEGWEGNDDLMADYGADRIDGGDGDDVIDDGDGRDEVHGGPGDDEVDSSHWLRADPDTYDGGPGVDTISYAGQRWPFVGVTVDFDGVADDGAPGENDSLTAFETLVGTNQDDVLTGDAEENMIVGLDGADVIDSVDGVSGNDWVDGGDGEQDVCRTDSGDPAQNCER